MKSLYLLCACVLVMLLASCSVLQKDKAEIKKVVEDVVDEAVDDAAAL